MDAAVVLMPVRDDALVLGPVFSARPLTLAVSDRHPYARRPGIDAEDLAGCPLIGVAGAAPDYWRLAQAPVVTPGGRTIPAGPAVSSLQEGLALVWHRNHETARTRGFARALADVTGATR